MTRRPSDPNAIIDELLGTMEGRPFGSMADAERAFAAQVNAYNTRPQQELGGLSPLQMTRLLHGDWSTTGALRVNDGLSADEIGDPDFLHNARAFLVTLRDEGSAKATAGGNLSREFVGRMLSKLRWPPDFLERVRWMNKKVDEYDAPPLEILRHVLQIARLIHRRKGFHISPAGRDLLDDARRGELLAFLFRTFFQRLDLRAVDGWDVYADLQQTIAFTFWKIRTEAETWTTPAHLTEVAWLEDESESVPPHFREKGYRDHCFRSRVVGPLVSFGLLESRDLSRAEKWERPIEVRITPLFDRMLRFDFGRQ